MHENFFRTGLLQALSLLNNFLVLADEALHSALALLSPRQCSATPQQHRNVWGWAEVCWPWAGVGPMPSLQPSHLSIRLVRGREESFWW